MDTLSPEVRAAEIEIDTAYKSNLLISTNLATAMWSLLLAFEHRLFMAVSYSPSRHRFQLEPLIDHYLYLIRWPVYWLRASSPQDNEQIPQSINLTQIEAGIELITLASAYVDFYKAFTQASRGIGSLSLKGNRLVFSGNVEAESHYEAYNRLVKPVATGYVDESLGVGFEKLNAQLYSSLRVQSDQFSYITTPKLVISTMELFDPILAQKFTLPNTWRFSRYSILDFRKVVSSILALSYLHYAARLLAADLGCKSYGIRSSLLITTPRGLVSRIVRYTSIDRNIVKEIVQDLTLGSHGISASQADPTQQPLIQITSEVCAIVPHLWINNAAERNFVVLINKIPREKALYLHLVQEKERIMRQRIQEVITPSTWRAWWGSLNSTLPDIDLAIIDPVNKACLLMELKWFIDPAEPRELLEKAEEIRKGVSQLLILKRAFADKDQVVLNRLEIESDYSIGFVVVSANWIGNSPEQDPEIPVVREHHLVRKLETTRNLSDVLNWLSRRLYLPEEGVHYEFVETESHVGGWTIQWYGFKPLIADGEFLPL